ncbi:LOW QUALITY PROTEIN: asparaginyl-tRNA synthetase-like [Scylla paramamosain]|uniref:LOW QUALITY PROTEIN: asparaginyl-tRNA synthetase-like n=1 Tax=Scylla paramamosain TaxID=85552 RepID=UPI00308364E2
MAVMLAAVRLGATRHGRSYSRIVTLLRDKPLQRRVEVNGWVKAVRRQKERTFVDLDDGSCVKNLQVVVPSTQRPPGLTFHAAVRAQGELRPSPTQRRRWSCGRTRWRSSGVEDKTYPFKPRHTHPPDHLRECPHLRPRDSTFAAMLRVRSQAKLSIQQYFDRHGFTCIDTPVLTANDCEGGGEVFSIQATPGSQNPSRGQVIHFFGHPTHLTVSGQLHLEAAASCLSKVYCFNPAFRAENSLTRRHLAEFWMVEAEEAFLGEEGLEGVAERVEGLVKDCVEEVVEKRQEEVALHWRSCEGREALIHQALCQPFIHITHKEAVDTLIRHAPHLSVPPPAPHEDLRREHEAFLTSHAGQRPVLVTHWPQEVKPFYMATVEGRPDVALALDLLLPEVGETAGGGVREPSTDVLLQRLPQDTQKGLQWYLEMRGLGGAPPTAGFGLGFERLVQFILGVKNIKDVVLFPRWAKHCLG